MKRSLLILGMTLVLALLAVGMAFAQDANPPRPVTDDEVNAIAKQLYCPVCENIPLDVCGTAACAQWRDLIREKLSQGWSRQQINQFFVDQYGLRVISTQSPLIYAVPAVAILLGGYLLYRALKAWQRPAPAAQPPTPPVPPSDPYVARLEEELRRR